MKMMKYESELQCGFRVGGTHEKRDPKNTNPEQTVSSLYFIVMHFLRIVHMSESHVSTCARSCTSIFGWLHPIVVAKTRPIPNAHNTTRTRTSDHMHCFSLLCVDDAHAGFNFIDLFDTFEYHGPINRGRFQINLPSDAGAPQNE